MSKKNIVIIDHRLSENKIESDVLGEHGLRVFHEQSQFMGSSEDLKQVEGILSWHTAQLDRSALSQCPGLKAIVRIGAGYDNVDLEYCRENGIRVSNVPDYGVDDVATHAVSLFLTIEKNLMVLNQSARTKAWGWADTMDLRRISSLNFSVVGLGRIGTAVAQQVRPLVKNVGYYDPFKPMGYGKSLGLQHFMELSELCEWSDVISFHCDLNESSRQMISKNFVDHCKPNALLVNTARGGLFGDDFLTLMDEKKMKLGSDVLLDEHSVRDDSVFQWCQQNPDRSLLTPHCAFSNSSSFYELRSKACLELLRLLNGEVPHYGVL